MLLLGNKINLLTSWKGEFVHDILEKGKKKFLPFPIQIFPYKLHNAFGYLRYINALT